MIIIFELDSTINIDVNNFHYIIRIVSCIFYQISEEAKLHIVCVNVAKQNTQKSYPFYGSFIFITGYLLHEVFVLHSIYVVSTQVHYNKSVSEDRTSFNADNM